MTLFLLLVGLLCSTVGADKSGWTLDKLECPSNEKFCSNMTCSLTPVSRFEATISVNCVGLKKPVPKILVRTITYDKVGKNKYKKGVLDLTMDVCELLDGGSNQFLMRFWPAGYKALGAALHPCPYTVL
jgi:Protein of unknown function (DUF1091)